MARYLITITEIGQERRTIGRRWMLGAGKTNAEYGYAPEVDTVAEYEREIYRQGVDELDLSTVILAVNGLR